MVSMITDTSGHAIAHYRIVTALTQMRLLKSRNKAKSSEPPLGRCVLKVPDMSPVGYGVRLAMWCLR